MPGEITVTYLNQGAGSLLERSIDLFGVDLDSFIIGDQFGFVPEATETAPRGNVTFNGSRNLMQAKYFDNGLSLRVMMIIPEQYNNIKIGNVVAYSFYRGEVRPILSLVMPEQIIKQNAGPEDDITPAFKYPGNRLIISFTVKYVDESLLANDIVIQVVTPTFSNLPMFGDDTQVPIAQNNPYPQFIVNDMSAAGGFPAFVTKDDNNQYWSTPLFQDIDSPKYGILDGGVAGDNYARGRFKYVWGNWYIYKSEGPLLTIGGVPYDDESDVDIIVGGDTY